VALHNPTGDGSLMPTMFPVTEGAPRAEFLVGAVFPLLLFSVQPDGMVWYRLEPLAVDRFRLAIHPCLPPAAFADPALAPAVEGLRAFLDAIHRQDIGACEGVQRGLRSRLAEPGRLSHLEQAIWQLARWVLERTGAAA
jgi:hypothetical protein